MSRAGLVPVMVLAQRTELSELAERQVRPGGLCGVNADLEVACLVAVMAAGTDSIEDMDLRRRRATDVLFGGQDAVHAGLASVGLSVEERPATGDCEPAVAGRAGLRAPLLPGREQLAFAGHRCDAERVCGHKKQGAGFGHAKIQGKSLLVRGPNWPP